MFLNLANVPRDLGFRDATIFPMSVKSLLKTGIGFMYFSLYIAL